MLLKQYNVAHVTGDAYSAEWCEAAFRKRNIRYVKSELPKSQLYIEALPHFTRHAISMPNHPKLLRELRLLERRTLPHGEGRRRPW